jgi:hypothetical protein
LTRSACAAFTPVGATVGATETRLSGSSRGSSRLSASLVSSREVKSRTGSGLVSSRESCRELVDNSQVSLVWGTRARGGGVTL